MLLQQDVIGLRTTAVEKRGVIKLSENHFHTPLQCLICLLYTNVFAMFHLMKKLYGYTIEPEHFAGLIVVPHRRGSIYYAVLQYRIQSFSRLQCREVTPNFSNPFPVFLFPISVFVLFIFFNEK